MKEHRVIDLREPAERRAAARQPAHGDTYERCLEMMAETVRKAYFAARASFSGDYRRNQVDIVHPAWDGGIDRYGKRKLPIWPRVVRHLVDFGADPLEYAQAQMMGGGRRRYPTPKQIMDQEGAAIYRRHCPDQVAAIRNRWDQNLCSIEGDVRGLVATCGWEYHEALRSTLFNYTWITATPLTRVILATLEGVEAVVERLWGSALCEYAFQRRDFDIAYGEHIGAELREEGHRLAEMALAVVD